MFITIRQYQASRAITDEEVRLVETGFVPLLKRVAGFVSYSLTTDGTQVDTGSTFQDRAGAEESVRLAAPWVKEHFSAIIPTPPSVITGDIRVRLLMAGRPLRYGVLRDYQVNPSDVDELVRRAEAGFVPIISAAPGFAAYSIIDAGNGRIITRSAFDTPAHAEESVRLAATYVKENLAAMMPTPPTVTAGQIRLSARADA